MQAVFIGSTYWSRQVFPYVPGLKVVTETRLGGVLLEHILKFALTTPVQVRANEQSASLCPDYDMCRIAAATPTVAWYNVANVRERLHV